MSSDRRVGLDLSAAGLLRRAFGSPAENRATADRSPPDAEAEQRFRDALADGEADASQASGEGAGDRLSEGTSVMSPFALFGGNPSSPEVGDGRGAHVELAAHLGVEVKRLMVGDGRSGNRQVRLELKDDRLPGVMVTIEECEGRLQVNFICRVESSRLQLNDALPELANTLAHRLAREVLMCVQTDDDEDLRLVECLGTA